MSDRKLRIGFVGTGGIAFAHLNHLVKMPDVELVACTDVNAGNLEKAKTQYNVKGLYLDWREMLRKEKLDAVDVCTPNALHKQPTIDALNAGCHVMVEKPLAMNAKEGAAMVAAARKNQKHLVIGFQHRYSAPVQMLKRAAAAGQFGTILVMKCQALRRRGIPNWGVFGRKELQGGGPLIDLGVHVMEMAHYVMGAPQPVAATGNVWTYLGDKPGTVACLWPNWDHATYTVEDLAVGQVRFANGAVLQVEASFAAHCEDKWGFNFLGDKGGGTLDGPVIYRDQDGYMVHTKPDFLPQVDGFAVKMRSFVETALYDKPTESPGEAGLAIQKMIDGIYESAARGREVAIK